MTGARPVSPARVVLTASVDTEEDNWTPTRDGITLDNIRALPEMHARMSSLGLKLTYFTAHSVASHAASAAILRQVAAAGGEIGAHLHPWNTPPLDEPMMPRNTMLKNLPPELQFRKLTRLTEVIGERLGVRPRAFRAGRFAVGPATVDALARLGYEVDSSVTPWVDWSAFDEGPSFFGAPQQVYRIGPDSPVTRPTADGPVIEVPLSTGFNRWPFARWGPLHRWLTTGVRRKLHLGGMAMRSGLLRRILLSPEGTDSPAMLRLARVLVSHGVEHIQIMWHSPTLLPGCTPFGRTRADVDDLFRKVAEFVEGLERFTTVRFATVSETARLVAGRGTRAVA